MAVAATLAAFIASPVAWAIGRDATDYGLPLLFLMIGFAGGARLGRSVLGLRRGRGHYRSATLQPLLVVAGVMSLAVVLGTAELGEANPGTLALQVSTMALLSAIGVLLTEDGFFRGALWGLLERAGRSTDAVLLWTAGAYALWYAPLLLLDEGLRGGSTEAIAVHTLNLFLLGLCWGTLRLLSGSLLVVAWAHGVWNGLTYTLFGFAGAEGAMSVSDPLRFDPERGWAGVALNAAAFLLLWRRWQRREALEAAVRGKA